MALLARLLLLLALIIRAIWCRKGHEEPVSRTTHSPETLEASEGRARPRLLRLQWQPLVLFGIALALCATTLIIRTIDSRYPVIDEVDLEYQQMGVYMDAASKATLMQIPEAEFTALGGRVPERRWSFSIDPGRTAEGTVNLVMLDGPGLWNLTINQELTVIIALPPGAVLDPDRRELRAESSGSCASWYDGKQVSYAFPDVQRSTFRNVVLVCKVPAVGDVNDLFFETSFHWPDETFAEAGFGRTAGAARFEYIPFFASDIEVPPARPGPGYGLEALEVRLLLDDGERLMESFPDPTGGSRGERSWQMDQGGEVEYLVERPSSRTLVQPASELALLLAGVALGLIPAVWRRR
jgi:hypothetical protein